MANHTIDCEFCGAEVYYHYDKETKKEKYKSSPWKNLKGELLAPIEEMFI